MLWTPHWENLTVQPVTSYFCPITLQSLIFISHSASPRQEFEVSTTWYRRGNKSQFQTHLKWLLEGVKSNIVVFCGREFLTAQYFSLCFFKDGIISKPIHCDWNGVESTPLTIDCHANTNLTRSWFRLEFSFVSRFIINRSPSKYFPTWNSLVVWYRWIVALINNEIEVWLKSDVPVYEASGIANVIAVC